MKISAFFVAIAMTVLTVASCGVLGQSSTTATTATTAVSGSTSGQQAGAALKTLYTQYKTDGKLDVTNLNNIINLATLAKNVEGLKEMSDKTAFYKDFAAGLILGSNNLVTNTTSNTVTSALAGLAKNVNLSDLAAVTSGSVSDVATKGTEVINNASDIVSSVTNILKIFK
ncbi:MAG: hypothetical protein J6A22_05570 [Bacteroidales bacterium]|nr:hypothetical protein [Bacteroidales bacterium]